MSDELPDGLGPSDSVWTVISANYCRARQSYHTDPQCRQIADSQIQRLSAGEAARDGISPCRSCAMPGAAHNGGGDTSVLEAVQQHVYEQTGEDPLADDRAFGDPQ